MQSPSRYIPRLKTALVLTGTGTAGAYHAGVLCALQEAGVKIDLIAGRGIGVVGAMFGAIDGGSRLWDTDGLWRTRGIRKLYRWRPVLRVATFMCAAAFVIVLVPFLALAAVLLAFACGLLLNSVGIGDQSLTGLYGRWLGVMFDPTALPVVIPQLVLVAVLLLLAVLFCSALATDAQPHRHRRAKGSILWRLFGEPLEISSAVVWFSAGLWRIMRGVARISQPTPRDLGTRYSELLAENLGQPGFKELLLLAHDLDARRDITFALLEDQTRQSFFHGMPGLEDERNFETVDLVDAERHRTFDALAAALSLPVATGPHLMGFSPESAWRGETHRVCDRPDATSRLLSEVEKAGAQQVILVSALPSAPGPHMLGAGRRDLRGQIGEQLVSIETAAIRDAVSARQGLFEALFEIRPDYNPLGPFDFGGCYDDRSDRRQTLAELVDRGYEDGFKMFVDAVVGASGELMENESDHKKSSRSVSNAPSISEQLAAHGEHFSSTKDMS